MNSPDGISALRELRRLGRGGEALLPRFRPLQEAILGLLPFSTELNDLARGPDGIAPRTALAEIEAEFILLDLPMPNARVLFDRGHPPARLHRDEVASFRENEAPTHGSHKLLA